MGRSRAGVFGMVTSYEMGGPEFESRQKQEIFPYPKRPRQHVGSIHSPGVKWIRHAKVKKECGDTSTPPPLQCLRAVERYNFAFVFYYLDR